MDAREQIFETPCQEKVSGVRLDGGGAALGDHFRARNDELFARRRELQVRIIALRADVDADARLYLATENALRQAERKFDDLTYEIMTTNYRLVRRYVTTLTSKSCEHVEDFESAGKVGLLRAISSYDPDRGPFSSWAFKPIQRQVLRAVRNAGHPIVGLTDFDERHVILAAVRAYLQET